MAELIKVNKKVINDPLFTPVIKFLQDRIAKLEVTGPADELALSKERYDGLVAGDLVIESAVTFPDGAVRVCIISRKTGFARVDIDIKQVEMEDILNDFAVALVEIDDVDHLKTYLKGLEEPVQPTLFYLKYEKTYGVLVTQEQAKTHEGAMQAFGDLFFENYVLTRESENSIDWETLESGTVTITDPSFGRGIYPLFIYELALSEAQLPEITSNLPASITSRRGESFTIPNTYWFAGTQDITTVATVELSTKSGYALLDRSSDLLDIDGETIYGSASEDITDQIVVRVTYDWNGRLVHKNFYIDLKIEKDLPNDLVITSVPTQVTATSGDTVELALTATYKGEKTEILIPPTTLKSQKGFGNLTYVKTNKDLSMVYRGVVKVSFPANTEQVADLWSAEFSINDNGTVVKSTGYVNSILVKPETLPKFSVTDVPTLLEGYKGNVGTYKPVIKYGEQVIPVNEVNLTTGIQGTKQLLDITDIDATTVSWELINDSGNPGQATRDTFTQTYSWLDPRGVLQSQSFTITVNVKLDSIINVIQGPSKRVRRYQFGGATWTLEVNGVASNNLITALSLDAPLSADNVDYIINRPKIDNQWFVTNADKEKELTFTGKFTFRATVDGKTQTFHVDQEFVIEKLVVVPDGNNTNPPPVTPTNPSDPNEQGTGPGGDEGPDNASDPGGSANPNSPGTGDGPYNSEITAVPTSFTIAGNSDRDYQMTFKVFKGTDDVTSKSEIMPDYTITPDYTVIKSITYDAASDMFVAKYTKNKGGVSKGAIFAKLKADSAPTKQQIARVWLNVNVAQIKILKVINPPTRTDLTVTEPKQVEFNVEFSGVKLALNDPQLKITRTGTPGNTAITQIDADNLTVLNDVWSTVGSTVNDPATINFKYTDPADGKVYSKDVSMTFAVTYPAMEVQYTASQEIYAQIWDKGTLPIKLVAGSTDFTSAISGITVVSGNKYVSISKLDWEVIFAEKTATSQIVGINIFYSVGQSGSKTLPADFKFNLAAWDGITFAASSYDPKSIMAASGDQDTVVATFVYKGKDATEFTQFEKALSTIPNTVDLGTVGYDPKYGLMIPVTLKRGGSDPMKLVFSAPGAPSVQTSITVQMDVAWPDDINIYSQGSDIRGYYQDTVNFPLKVLVAQDFVDLTDANMEVTLSSGTGDPIKLVDILADGLNVLLDEGGTVGTSYNYTVNIGLKYTNQKTGKVYTKTITVPSTIRVPSVKVGKNPIITGNVFQTGKIPITLIDERGKDVAITSYAQSGAGANVSLYGTDEWYIMNGATTGPSQGELPLRLGYSMGGNDLTIDVTEEFTINKWDGVYFRAETSVTAIKGQGGDTGDIPFNFTYVGFPVTGVTLDRTRSKIPDNISVSELDNNTLTYTLSGQDTTTLELCFIRPDAGSPMVAGRDYAIVDFSVETQSSDLPFTLVSNDDAITLDWGKTGVVKFVVKYGDKVVPNNAPGLVVTLKNADVHGIAIQSVSKDGITVKATRSDVAGSTKVYPESFNVSYKVGAPQPKTVSFDTKATISMGPAAISNNEKVNAVIWGLGSFRQVVQFNGVTLNTIDHFEIRDKADNKYIEVTGTRGYEVIGAEPTTTTQSVPMTVYYKVDGVDEPQKLDFDASFEITGSTSVRFKVNVSPTKIEGSLDNETTLTCTPIYKDKYVGSAATFKPDLSTIPKELTLKDYKVVNNSYVLTFVGAAGGVDTMTLVFWSPDAGTAPKARDVATVSVDVKVMGELGLEIGTRDNLITGKNADTGTYRFQILFGGIPIDAAAEIANGNLTATREVGAATSTNANVTTISKWNAASFDYTLNGCVVPGATANVSDFINLSYTYGGSKYTARVEIPLKYTSSTPTFGGWPTGALPVFSKGSLAPTATCDGANIASGITNIANYGDTDDKYITLGGTAKTYEVIWGETTQTNHNVSTRIIGQYRTWPWSVIVDVPFTIAAWNQKTWDPTFTVTQFSIYEDATQQSALRAKYKNATATLSYPGSDIDLSRSDLKGLISVAVTGRENANNQTIYYTFTGVKAGKGTIKLCVTRPGATQPGIENQDFTYVTMDVEVLADSLVITGPSILPSGGSNETMAASQLIILKKSNNSKIANNASGMVIKSTDTTIAEVAALAASTVSLKINLPYTTATGNKTVPLSAEYTDPTTGKVLKGTLDYPFTLVLPADYPVATQTTAANTVVRLWDYGPNPFSIKSGSTDITTSAVPTAVIDDQVGYDNGTNYMQLSLDQPVAGTWWWITKAVLSSSQQTRKTKWKINVPYRNDTISIDAVFTYIRAGDGANPTPEFQGTGPSSAVMIKSVGEQVELPFKLLWRNYKYSKGVFKPTLSGNDTDKFADYFKVVSQRYDDTDGTTYLKIEALKTYEGSMIFVWDKADASANPTAGVDRVSLSASFYSLIVTPIAKTWNMWNNARFNTLVSIKDGDTEISAQCLVNAISSPLLVNTSSGANPNIQAQSDVAIAEQTVNVTFDVQLPSAYGNRVIKVIMPEKFAAYDGNEFVLVPFGNQDLQPRPLGTLSGLNASTINFRGVGVSTTPAYTSMTTADYVALNGPGFTFGTKGVSGAANVWSSTYNKTGDQFVGTVKHPIHYTGPGYDKWPKGTLGKNYIEYPQVVTFYENALRIYPDDTIPAAVSGAFNATVAVPVKFSVGTNIDANIQLANASGMTESIVGSTMAGLVSYTGNSATGINLHIDYDNRGDDVTVDVPMRANINRSLYGYAVNSNRDWTQKVTIKGTKQGDTTTASNVTSPSTSVWAVGGSLPFSIVNNGTTVATSKYKSITIDDNGYIRRPETTPGLTSRVWECYNGDKAASQHTARFTVVFNDGVKDITFVQDIVFQIAAYDGIDLKITMVGLSDFNKGMVALIGGNANAIEFTGTYRGVTLNGGNDFDKDNGRFKVWPAKSNVPAFNLTTPAAFTYGSKGAPLYYYQSYTYTATGADMDVSKDGYIVYGLRAKENDATAVEGKDFIKVPMPYYVYLASRIYVNSNDSTLSGKYGDGTSAGTTIRLSYSIRRGLTTIANNAATTAVDPAILGLGTASNVGFEPVWFLKELTSAPQKTTRVKFTLNSTSAAKDQSTFNVDVTQISNYAFPTVSNLNTVETSINQSGGIPFKITDDTGKDITDQATISAVSANDYIQLKDGKWFCYNARSGDTTVKVTLTFAITYKGNALNVDQDVTYLIKAFSGQPTVSNVQIVNGNVWDRGSVIPFTVMLNGNPVPSSWITGLTGVAANSRVTVPSVAVPWNIVAGDTSKAVSDTVTYTVTVSNGTTTWTVKQDVVFNIAQYDGVEFKLRITNLNANGEIAAKSSVSGTTYNARVYIEGTYRGEVISTGITVKELITGINISSVGLVNGGGTSKIFDCPTKTVDMVAQKNVASFTRSGSTGNVENVDFAKLVIPVTTYTDDKLAVSQTPASITGKLGDVFDITADLRYSGVTKFAVNDSKITVTIPADAPIEMVPNSLTATGYKVRFKSDVTQVTTTTATINYNYQVSATTGRFATASLSITQQVAKVQPDVKATGSMAAIKYGETGNIILTGTVGTDTLAGKVTFVPASSDNKGLVSFGSPVDNSDGTVSIPVTGTKVGKDNLTIHITVNGATGNASGKDYLDIIVAAEVQYADLSEGDGFETNASGTNGTPVTLTQWTYGPSN